MTEGGYARTARLTDQFTDHGITGLLLAMPEDGALRIGEWLLSCRILGRRVEDAMFAAAWNFAWRSGLRSLRASFRPTPKNGQVADLYDRMGMTLESEQAGVREYVAAISGPRAMPECFAAIELSESDLHDEAARVR
jgi:predicted enzyme involved in methoxymalonyl-ACP biosynthesis